MGTPQLSGFESYYLYLGNYPSHKQTGWHEDVQGVTHDDDHWFITQTEILWKIPVTHDLNREVSPNTPGVKRVSIEDFPALSDYNHFGDLTYYEFEGQGYLCIPLEHINDESEKRPALGIFRADTLQYIDHEQVSKFGQADAPWCAVDPEGFLYSSNSNDVSRINKYRVDWQTLRSTRDLRISAVPALTLLDERGRPISLSGTAGGVFSPSGQLLYIVAHGIHVFDVSSPPSVKRVQQSGGSEHPYFRYEFNPGDGEEPEGLTIWDLDDGRAPGIRGQLHVLLFDEDWPSSDEIYFKHYTGTIYVNGAHAGSGDSLAGAPANPFKTVGEAHDLAWDGAQIKIKAGVYRESLTFSKRLRVLADGGTVRIGP
jgi:hypothetical protein